MPPIVRLPVLRNATIQQGVLEESLSKKFFNRIIKSVLDILEYFGSATVYPIPHCLGKKINSDIFEDK